MSEDPTYEYIRGHGWAPAYERKILTHDRDDVAIWIIDRAPEIGEWYLGYNSNEEAWYDGRLKFEAPITFMKEWNTKFMEPLKNKDESLGDYNHYCTIILAEPEKP